MITLGLRITVVAAAFVCAAAHGADLPCSIEQVRSTANGVTIRFSEHMFWHYEDSLGHYGIIGVGGVTEFVELPNGHEEILPSREELQLEKGASLKLHEHHAGCSIKFEGERALRINSSHSFLGKSSAETDIVSYE